jgi:hypothetical protein
MAKACQHIAAEPHRRQGLLAGPKGQLDMVALGVAHVVVVVCNLLEQFSYQVTV